MIVEKPTLLILIALTISACSLNPGDGLNAELGFPDRGVRFETPYDAISADVLQVINGITIEVEIDGERQVVRYAGIRPPETDGVSPYGQLAFDRNRELVEGKTVYLEKEASSNSVRTRDLRYVYVDGVMVNAVLIREGLARIADVSSSSSGLKYPDVLYRIQNDAIMSRRGGWNDDWRNYVRHDTR